MVRDPASRPVTCVIDGLDECDEYSYSWIVDRVVSVMEDTELVRAKSFRILIVSRKNVRLNGCTSIDLDHPVAEEQASDLSLFINHRLDGFSRTEGFDQELRSHVWNTLVTRYEGSFLWLGFVTDELRRKRTCSDSLIALEEFPKGLRPLYDRMLLQIEPQHRTVCATILKWAILSLDPISLSELAVILQLEDTTQISLVRATNDRVIWCEPLLRLENGPGEDAEPRIFLVHQSLRTHLTTLATDNQDLKVFSISMESDHLQMTRRCLDYLLESFPEDIWDCYDKPMQQRYPLMCYFTKAWGYHARNSGAAAIQLLDL
jgi:hypothetical protein